MNWEDFESRIKKIRYNKLKGDKNDKTTEQT